MSERYEEVRRKLVERGYLQGRIERFLLRDLVASRAPRALARTSLKAAAVGAPLLGGVLAASTVAANRPALGARDALVLWLYFALLAGAALFALDLIAAGVAAAWARRRGARPSDALRAGLLVAVPVLAYLVVVWAAGRPERGFGADALFLVAAIAATALVAWLAGIVSLAGIVGKTGEVPDRNRRSAVVLLLVLVPIAAAFFLLPAARHGGGGAVAPSPFAAPERPGRLVLVGIDGLDGALVEALTAAGATDHLLAAIARGAMYPKHREPALEPPEVWTTIATGMRVEDHGVRSAGATRLPGVAAPITPHAGPAALDAALRFLLPSRTVAASGAGRRVRALWEIAGLAHPSASVGWWASWPARGTEGDPPAGYVVSDRALAKLLAGAAEDHDTAPEALFARLARDFPADRAALRAAFDARFGTLPEEVRALAWESVLIDAFAWTTTRRLLEDPQVASAFAYLPGLDILRTRLVGPRAATPAQALVAAQAVEAYVRWLDAAVFADLPGRGDRVMIVADPGRSAGDAAEGFVAAAGDAITPACVGPTVGDLDVAPLALRLMALPPSAEMPGRLPTRCFEAAAPAPRAIATWGRRGRSAQASMADDDPEMVERLKSLGYLR